MIGASEPRRLARGLGVPPWLLPWLFVAASSAYAQPAGLQLEVSADAQDCVSEASLRARLERILRVHRPIDVEVVVHADAEPVAFELRHDGVFAAERRFDLLPSGCSARLDALALAIAVAVEHAVGSERASLEPSALTAAPAEPAPTNAETPTTTPEPKPREPKVDKPKADKPKPAKPEAAPKPKPKPPAKPKPKPAAKPKPPAKRSAEAPPAPPAPSEPPAPPGPPLVVRVLPFVGGDVLIEALPELALAVHGGAELRLGRTFAVSLAGLFAPPIDVDFGEASAESSLLSARALGCAGSAPRGLRVEACAGAIGGVVWASGEGEGAALQSSANASMGFLAGVLRVAASYPADGAFGLRLALDGQLNVVRPELRVAGVKAAPPNPSIPTVDRVAGLFGAAGSIEVWLALP